MDVYGLHLQKELTREHNFVNANRDVREHNLFSNSSGLINLDKTVHKANFMK